MVSSASLPQTLHFPLAESPPTSVICMPHSFPMGPVDCHVDRSTAATLSYSCGILNNQSRLVYRLIRGGPERGLSRYLWLFRHHSVGWFSGGSLNIATFQDGTPTELLVLLLQYPQKPIDAGFAGVQHITRWFSGGSPNRTTLHDASATGLMVLLL